MRTICLSLLVTLFTLAFASVGSAQSDDKENNEKADQLWCQYSAKEGAGNGKHVVLISGDDEYRSEEALPMLGKILAVRHGFNCTVLFATNKDGIVQPNHQKNIPGMHFLESADLVVLGLRFRNLPDEDMKYFDEYLESGKPIIAVRTSTHAFKIPEDRTYAKYSFNSKKEWVGGFGQKVLGDTWISHHGKHGKQSTRGVIDKDNASHPVLADVKDVWGPTDVYGIVNLPKTAKVLLHGQVLEGMKPESQPVDGKVNAPMMPIAWTTTYESKSGKSNRIFCTTMGAATDFQSADLRRMMVNASFWSLDLEPGKGPANVDYVDPYEPTKFGFKSFQKNRKPAFYNLKNSK